MCARPGCRCAPRRCEDDERAAGRRTGAWAHHRVRYGTVRAPGGERRYVAYGTKISIEYVSLGDGTVATTVYEYEYWE